MPRGGKRQGKPGAQYSNRSDLRDNRLPVTPYKGQPYGTAKQQEDSQRAVPLGAPAVPGPPAAAAPLPAQGPGPGTLGGILDPTARPDEPLTAGLDRGPGVDSSGLRKATGDPDIDLLYALYRANPSPTLAALIEDVSG